MRIAVYGREFAEDSTVYIKELFRELNNAGVEIILFSKFVKHLSQRLRQSFDSYRLFHNHKELLAAQVDMVLTIGGDGTILDASTVVRDSQIPILGVNTGRLGFLANMLY
jgi:NAD+ kinase